jgi:hypothetical protein
MSKEGKAEKKLFAKLASVMEEVTNVPKNGYNQHFKYSYITEADLSDAIRPLLAKQGVGLLFEVVDVKQLENNICQVQVCITLSDDETEKKVTVFGHGQDKGDKGIYKAMTGAVKYWLYKTFLISTNDDPEQDEMGSGKSKDDKPAAGQATQTNEDEANARDWKLWQDHLAKMNDLQDEASFNAYVDQNRDAIQANRYRAYAAKYINERRSTFGQAA